MKTTIKNIFFDLRDTIGAFFVALKSPDVSLLSKILIVIAIAYALSPIDLIPDFIPFAGYIDDAIIVPFLVFIAIKSIPKPIYEECKQKASLSFKKGIGFIALGILMVLLLWGIVGFALYALFSFALRLLRL